MISNSTAISAVAREVLPALYDACSQPHRSPVFVTMTLIQSSIVFLLGAAYYLCEDMFAFVSALLYRSAIRIEPPSHSPQISRSRERDIELASVLSNAGTVAEGVAHDNSEYVPATTPAFAALRACRRVQGVNSRPRRVIDPSLPIVKIGHLTYNAWDEGSDREIKRLFRDDRPRREEQEAEEYLRELLVFHNKVGKQLIHANGPQANGEWAPGTGPYHFLN